MRCGLIANKTTIHLRENEVEFKKIDIKYPNHIVSHKSVRDK